MQEHQRRFYTALLMIVIVLHINSCKKKREDSTREKECVHLDISPSAHPGTHRLQGHNLLSIRYDWQTGKNFVPPDEPLLVKVHFVDANGNVVFQDDHELKKDIRRWKPSKTYAYDHVCYVPLIPKETELRIMIGLYSPGQRRIYRLNAPPEMTGLSEHGEQQDKYTVDRIVVFTPVKPEDLPDAHVEYINGWYLPEQDDRLKTRWRWMGGRAMCQLENPGRDARLFIDGWIPTEQLAGPADITLQLGGKDPVTYAGLSGNFHILLPVPNTDFQNEKYLDLVIETDQTYVPAEKGISSDNRKLGVMVRLLFFN